MQSQVIEKERQVCELQTQLAEELAKRQAVQYQVIEKDRRICMLQQQLFSFHSVMPQRQRMLMPPATEQASNMIMEAPHEDEPDHEQPAITDEQPPRTVGSRATLWQVWEQPEPDDEQPPRMEQLHMKSPRNSLRESPGLRSAYAQPSLHGGYMNAPTPAQPHTPQSARTNFTSYHQSSTVYRNSASNTSSAVIDSFVRNFTPPALVGSNPTAEAPKPGNGPMGGNFRGRAYWQRRGSNGVYMGSSGSGGGTNSPPPTQDRLQRRLLLASRTFT